MTALLPDRQRTAAALLAGWTPERLLQTWIDEVSALGIAPHNLVQTVAAPPGTPEQLAWWPRAGLLQLRLAQPERRLRLAEAEGSACSGQRQTLRYLLDARGDACASAAVLLAASLFARVERARSRYPREAWPPFAAAQTLLAWTRARHDYRWPCDCEASLPAHLGEDGLVLGNLEQLVRFCAVEHARVLHRLAPLQLMAADTQLDSGRAPDGPRLELLTLSQPAPAPSLPAPAHSLRAPRDPGRRRDPRWNELTRADLEALIWQKPQRELAREFGVSETTVAKRCKVLAIAKPERGFWRRRGAVGG